jgi:aminoglycoside 6'-N-acetyltransferase I
MDYSEISESDLEEWLVMAMDLWPYGKDELKKLFYDILLSPAQKSFIVQEKNHPIAFINLSLRNDYVEGSETSPVGYIEGIYVRPEFRKKGIAKKLIALAEKWTLEQGCTELGSDTELRNIESQKFHKRTGFTKSETIVHFIKKINLKQQND